jgi:uncharacterized protein YndB with AHSA1/START domain
MKNALQFDFVINREAKTIHVVREFNAAKNLVWNCWTQSEFLDQWWAPKPYQNQTISMNFSAGGKWHYAMISPAGEKHFCKAYYSSVQPTDSYTYHDAFCDEEGIDNTVMPGMNWQVSFTAEPETTVVNILITFETEAALENIITMGFKEGFTMGLGNLDELLEKL